MEFFRIKFSPVYEGGNFITCKHQQAALFPKLPVDISGIGKPHLIYVQSIRANLFINKTVINVLRFVSELNFLQERLVQLRTITHFEYLSIKSRALIISCISPVSASVICTWKRLMMA